MFIARRRRDFRPIVDSLGARIAPTVVIIPPSLVETLSGPSIFAPTSPESGTWVGGTLEAATSDSVVESLASTQPW